MEKNTREKIFNVLEEIENKEGYSNIVLNRYTKGLESREANFMRELVYGVLENKIYLEWLIMQFSKIKLNKLSKRVLLLVKIGTYQILKMDKVPDSAAVNETMKISKKYVNRGAQGFINGMLRNISRNKDNLPVPIDRDTVKYLSIVYSYPEWMIKDWISQFGESFTRELCAANSKTPSLNIRVNTLKIEREELISIFEDKGKICERGKYGKDTIVVLNPNSITDTEEYRSGLFTIQDESSSLVAQAMNPLPHATAVDVCSAPGGKTTHLAQYMKNEGFIIARDIHLHKLKLIQENADRLGIDIIKVEKADASITDKSLIEKADYCLVDAPCSGLGLIRKKPEIKYNKKESEVRNLPNIQKSILKASSKYVKSGGVLVYSTCTINRFENIEVVNSFLKENPDFKLSDFRLDVNISGSENGYIELFPHIHGTDGFFIAKMIRI